MITEYYLGLLRATKPEVDGKVWLDRAEYDALRESVYAVVTFAREQTFTLVVRNYLKFRGLLDEQRQRLLGGGALTEDWQAVYHELQLSLLDWLLATRLSLDHSRADLAERFGGDSEQIQAFDEVRRQEHFHHFGYRLMYDLRDYCSHKGMPPLSFRVSGDVHGARLLELGFEPAELLGWKKWHSRTKADLVKMAEPIAADPRVTEAMDCLSRIAVVVRELTAPHVLEAARATAAAAERVDEPDALPSLISMELVDSHQPPRRMSPLELPVALAHEILRVYGHAPAEDPR